MKKLLIGLLCLAVALPALAQKTTTNDQTITASGSSISFFNGVSGTKISVEEDILGRPSVMSIVVAGCDASDSCSTLNTYTGTTSTVVGPISTGATVYDHFKITATWTGSGVSVEAKSTVTGAQQSYPAPSSGGGTWGSITGTLANQSDLNSALAGKAASNAATTVNGESCALGSTCSVVDSSKQADLGYTSKTGTGTEGLGCDTTGKATGDVFEWDGTKCVPASLGFATSRTVADAAATYTTTDKNKRIIRTLTSPQTDVVPAISASYPDGFLFEIINSGSATITLSGGYTGYVYVGETARLRSNGTTWEKSSQYSGTIPVQRMPAGVQKKTCVITIGDGTNTIADADISPWKQGSCYFPDAVTIVEVELQSDAGTPSVLLEKRTAAATLADVMSAALSANGTTRTCARPTTSATCYDGTTSDGTVTVKTASSANVLAAGDIIEPKSGTGSTAKNLRVYVTVTVN